MDEPTAPRRQGLQGTVKTLDRVIGEQLRELRQAAGYTQEELALALAEVPSLGGAWRHRQTVSAAEAGVRHFSAEDLVGLAAFFGVPIPFLLEPFMARAMPERLRGEVEVGRTRIPTRLFHSFIEAQLPIDGREEGVALLEEPGRVPRTAMNRLAPRDEDRRWGSYIADGVPAGEAYGKAREEHLSRPGRRRPGPTVMVITDGEWSAGPASPWRTGNVRLRVKPGRPYTARDELEAEIIQHELLSKGLARRVRPRPKKEGAGE
jgi:transcriptional regulator with XRE-family HTH domain